MAVQVLIGVALLSGHDRCQHLLATWLDHPAAFCFRAERACLHLRDWLTAGDSEATAIRREAYALIARPVRAAARLRLSAEATADGRLAFDRAARVAALVSRNLKIAATRPARKCRRTLLPSRSRYLSSSHKWELRRSFMTSSAS